MILSIEKESALRSAYINNIAARVRTHWRYQGAGYDWTAEVYVAQDRDGTVLAVDIRNTNIGDSNKAKSFINSIERAVYKASPLPAAPDESVFNEQIIFTFNVK
jgi:colicin import membrane protein